MAPTKQTTIRLSTVQRSQLKRLAEKLQIDQANVIRLAITRLAEQEGIILIGKRTSTP
jgi:predicted DNA-binding protein